MTKVTIHPSRIGCPSIPGTIKGIVMSVDGVVSVDVRYDEQSLDVEYDEDRVAVEAIIKKIGGETGLRMEQASFIGASKSGNADESCPM